MRGRCRIADVERGADRGADRCSTRRRARALQRPCAGRGPVRRTTPGRAAPSPPRPAPSSASSCATPPPLPCPTTANRSIPRCVEQLPHVARLRARCRAADPRGMSESPAPIRSGAITRKRAASSGTNCRHWNDQSGKPCRSSTGGPVADVACTRSRRPTSRTGARRLAIVPAPVTVRAPRDARPPRAPRAPSPSRRARAATSTPCAAHHATAPAVPSMRSAGSSTPVSSPMNRLRDAPTSTGTRRSRNGADVVQQRQVVLEVLAEADARVDASCVARHARRHRGPEPRGRNSRTSATTSVVAGLVLHRLGLALHVHQHQAGARLPHQRRTSRDPRRRVTSFTMAGAGGERRAGDRGAARVDADRGRRGFRVQAARSPAAPGRAPPRRDTRSAPGRVDSPPTSRMSAPSATICSPCFTASSAPSEHPAVAERVGRDVHDAHDQGPLPQREHVVAAPPHGALGHADHRSRRRGLPRREPVTATACRCGSWPPGACARRCGTARAPRRSP